MDLIAGMDSALQESELLSDCSSAEDTVLLVCVCGMCVFDVCL